MQEQLNFNLDLARKAWRKPDKNGIWYKLETRSKIPAYIVYVSKDPEDRSFSLFPLCVRMRNPYDPTTTKIGEYTSTGSFIGWLTYSHYDLCLYRCDLEEYDRNKVKEIRKLLQIK